MVLWWNHGAEAWEGKRLNDFIAHYHPGFSNKGKSLSDWKTYKGRLNRKNRKIAVRISDVRVRVNGEKARVYFRQRYRSDTFRSSSYKILECRKKDGRWKIFRENSFTGKPGRLAGVKTDDFGKFRSIRTVERHAGHKTSAGIRIDFSISRQDLADYPGTTLYTVSRTLSAWQQNGWIKSGRQQIVVTDSHALVRFSETG